MRLFSRTLAVSSIALLAAQNASAQLPNSIYKRTAYQIPMRDGVKLYTVVYTPRRVSGRHPILLERTPYGSESFFVDQPYIDAGYIIAEQDVRGAFMSEGQFMDIRPEPGDTKGSIDEATDTYDTVDYLVKHVADNNGSVGLHGVSYPGFYAAAGGINTHPALKAISPQAPVSNWFVGDDFHHNGAFFLQDAFDFGVWFFYPRKGPEPNHNGMGVNRDRNSYRFFLNTGSLSDFEAKYFNQLPFIEQVMSHPNYDDWWKARALPPHLQKVRCAVLTVGGFFDAEDMWGALHTFQAVRAQNPATPSFLVMGPWFHGMWAFGDGNTFGDLDFGQNTASWFRQNVEFPFFEKYLRGKAIAPPAKATMFETGINKWRLFPAWPPTNLSSSTFFLGSQGALHEAKPGVGEPSDSYVEDPANPTPYLADPATEERTREYMVDDQRWAEKRPDVATYKSAPLDSPLQVAGTIDVSLWASTSGTDSDFVVKVIDVWPSDSKVKSPNGIAMAGYEQELRADIMRGKYRNSYENPQPFVPDQPTLIHFKLNDVCHEFLRGHRIMVQIQSAWFPLVDRNPNRFEDIYKAKDSDFTPATIHVFHDAGHPSAITFGVMPE
jgi:putative CocE/NonD family hydrolase